MFTKAVSQPHSFLPGMLLNNTSATSAPLKNAVTGALVNVKHANIDFCKRGVLNKEAALFSEIKKNNNLVVTARAAAHTNFLDRLKSVGMAVTAIDSMGNGKAQKIAAEICDNNPRNAGANRPINNRGLDFIDGFFAGQSKLDSTVYAIALGFGLDTSNKLFDPIMCQQFNNRWNDRLNQTS